jgi:RND family efflux transporter MFP subunit
MSKKIITVIIIIVVVALGIAAIMHKKKEISALTQPQSHPIAVLTATVREGAVSDMIQTVALIQSETASTISAQVNGGLLEMRFHEGDTVKKGQIMARIDPRPLRDQVDAAEARLAAAKETYATQQAIYNRDKALFNGGAISRQELELSSAQLASVKASLTAAERALETAKTYLSYADVPAPYSGIVTARLMEPGDLAVPGKPLYTLQTPGPVKLISKLSQDDLKRLTPDSEVTFRWGENNLRAKIKRLYPALDASHLGSVETNLPKSPFNLPAGATLTAEYATAPVHGLVVPTTALFQSMSATLVVRISDGKADPVPVTVLRRGAKESVVSGGLKQGDIVVTGLPSELMALTAGTPLSVASKTGGQP